MSRTHIAIDSLLQPDGGSAVIFRIELPGDVQEADRARFLDCGAAGPLETLTQLLPSGPPPDADVVALAGDEVFRRISSHPGIRDALERAVNAQGPEASPIFIETNAEEAEFLPWEALRHPARGFLALQGRWPIVRVSGRRGNANELERVLDLPLRVAAVLAASERDARPEWAALHGALSAWGGAYHVNLFTCQRELHDEVAAEADPHVTLDWVPGDVAELVAALKRYAPHVLHFFSHGSAQYGGYLEVARLSTMEAGAEPHFLNAGSIAPLCGAALLVVLNACEGAMPVRQTGSLSHQLVRDGVPVVIGMREAIDSGDAHLFCEQLYRDFLRRIDEQLQPYIAVELDLTGALGSPRARLCARHPGPSEVTAKRHKEWTLPALYLRPEPLRVELIPVSTDPGQSKTLVAALNTLRRRRASLGDAPEAFAAPIDTAITDLGVRLQALEAAGG